MAAALRSANGIFGGVLNAKAHEPKFVGFLLFVVDLAVRLLDQETTKSFAPEAQGYCCRECNMEISSIALAVTRYTTM